MSLVLLLPIQRLPQLLNTLVSLLTSLTTFHNYLHLPLLLPFPISLLPAVRLPPCLFNTPAPLPFVILPSLLSTRPTSSSLPSSLLYYFSLFLPFAMSPRAAIANVSNFILYFGSSAASCFLYPPQLFSREFHLPLSHSCTVFHTSSTFILTNPGTRIANSPSFHYPRAFSYLSTPCHHKGFQFRLFII